MIEMLVVGALTAAAVLFLMAKINIRRFLWCEVLVDVLFTALMIVLFAGTLGGMIAAVFAGLILSAVLWVLKRRIGYERPKLRKGKIAWERCNDSVHRNGGRSEAPETPGNSGLC